MLLLGLAIFLDHVLDFSDGASLRLAGHRRLVVKAGIEAALVRGRQHRKGGDQILIVQVLSARAAFAKA